MLTRQAPTVLLTVFLVVAAVAVWTALPDSDHDPPAPGGADEADVSPADLDRARHIASQFALALFADDHPQMRTLATGALTARLFAHPQRHQPVARDVNAAVDAIIIRNVYADRVRLDVVVRRHGPHTDRLDTLVVTLTHTLEGWRVDELTF